MDELTANQLMVLLYAYSNTQGGIINLNTLHDDVEVLEHRNLVVLNPVLSDMSTIKVTDEGHEFLNKVLRSTAQLAF